MPRESRRICRPAQRMRLERGGLDGRERPSDGDIGSSRDALPTREEWLSSWLQAMQTADFDLRAKLAQAIEALILPRNHATAIGDAAQHVVLALMRATEIDETDAAPDRRLALEILTPRGNDDYQSHAAKLREAERHQAGLTLFRLYCSIGGAARQRQRVVRCG